MTIAALPMQAADETGHAFALRVDVVYHAHLKACAACLCSRACFACEAGEDDPDPRLHACNCELAEPVAFGVALRRLYVQTRPARMYARQLARKANR
jgi:hypothetical protein